MVRGANTEEARAFYIRTYIIGTFGEVLDDEIKMTAQEQQWKKRCLFVKEFTHHGDQ